MSDAKGIRRVLEIGVNLWVDKPYYGTHYLVPRAYHEERDAEIKRLRKGISRALLLLDRALGDTDPDNEPDEYEDPVFHAFRALAEIIGGEDD